MSLRRQPAKDSLDLLLDTMSNVFGAIILMAVLVALLARQPNVADGNAPESSEILGRRVAQAALTLEKTKSLVTDLQGQHAGFTNSPILKQIEERQFLLRRLEELRSQSRSASNRLDQQITADPAQRLMDLKAQLARALSEHAEASNRWETLQGNNLRLEERIAGIQSQFKQAQSDLTRTVRFPKEKASEKRVFNFIVQYGSVYPCRRLDQELNDSSITWKMEFGGLVANPIPRKGFEFPRDKAKFESILQALSKNSFYMAFYVFEDSFQAFNLAKKMAVSAGFEYGWKPFQTSESPLLFVTSGIRPPPQ